ncbi:hypothetical protein, partial [Bacteroides oleiciplenus]|uniref:hypothetical protein n=1 Tax=Bacteroides oleiciplenus TaxID=626931 RepID=UPI0026DC53CA
TRDPNLGKVMLYQLSYFRDCGCKGRYFLQTCKHSGSFFREEKYTSALHTRHFFDYQLILFR